MLIDRERHDSFDDRSKTIAHTIIIRTTCHTQITHIHSHQKHLFVILYLVFSIAQFISIYGRKKTRN